jgi:putative membrane protein
MELVLLAFALAGCFFGIVTGLFPGLHVNSISLIVLALPGQKGLPLIVFIACMATVHTFVDFVPSVLLGAPSQETFLAVLPGHRLLLKGEGLTAVRLTVAGGLFAGLASLAAGPFLVLLAVKSQSLLSILIPFALLAILAAMAFDERGWKKGIALAVILLSGLLGLLALKSDLPVQQPLFCLATGFFGASTLVDSIVRGTLLGKQRQGKFSVSGKSVFGKGLLALGAASFVSLMPSVGASQAAFVVRKLVGRIRTRDYLLLLGGVNTGTMILSFFVLFSIGKTRTGAAAAIGQLSPFGVEQLLLVAGACLFALGFAAIATDLLASALMRIVHLINYRKVNFVVLFLVSFMIFCFSGFLGFAFYGIATLIGLASLGLGIKRSNSMAFLMVPTMAYYFGFV